MAITSVALNNTFDEWRIRTNQVITSINTINEANASLSGSITITNPLSYNGNVSLNVSSGMIKGDGGLLTNLQSSIVATAAFNVANAAFDAANAAPQAARVNTIFTVANAAFDAANLASSTSVNTIFSVANAGYTVANAGYTVANAGYTVANAAFDKANTVAGAIAITNETSSSSTFYVTFTGNTSGNVTTMNVSTSALTFIPSTGTLSATVFNSLSDSTLKDNVSPINNALDIINNMSGVGFDWKESGKHSFGVLAQDMEKIIPDLVGNVNNLKTVNYDGIIAFLIEAIKELNKKIENK